ncbi:MAG: hypothetical protein JWN04_1408 [Myxococcaceae bacterium]|nr:hypothetical protein [Myxococcaceae bacterium]
MIGQALLVVSVAGWVHVMLAIETLTKQAYLRVSVIRSDWGGGRHTILLHGELGQAEVARAALRLCPWAAHAELQAAIIARPLIAIEDVLTD